MNSASDFDKKDWIRELKQLKKEFILEDRERYRPLHNLKRELKEDVEDIEKEEKKLDIQLKKDYASLLQIIEKQRTEIS